MVHLPYRIGFGYDVHRLESGYPLWLGGIKIDHELGLEGHSDADVLLHTLCDALLGAAALGDIGVHFPPTDMKYKGIDSKILLREVCRLIHEAGYRIGNLDATIAAEAPKLNPHIPQMRACIAEVCGIDLSQISVKATTTERLGFTGRREGMSCYAVALILPLEP
ncbi:2-C-methyl-D-erythritol 2,4-cyclodiphosphate synthase [Porphyromonas sp. COT-239 OH1446]|uniref:2-C-methyl-D-erythritol 2,4-cyclodiphosphate synthase n=1 Tax=Porphyromonas sp. COT-239 OH1446 TaxID=1515613 RepID=UPI00052CAD83|nr:2-C-methyl-D-erythritol 2,4-cyclodiphosphate synthase [Porphyromonas sp. COT-239 OH1446]KGN68398.1 2-C-methyl-D-erythritol 2,4-cyclodiphosphate synthase [Porphyromonas sp. COT-239 OH1446]